MSKSWDFVDKFTEARDTELHTDCSKNYFKYASLWLISTMAKRSFYYLPRQRRPLVTKPGSFETDQEQYLPLWICLLGPSRISRRTTLMRQLFKIVKLICSSKSEDEEQADLREEEFGEEASEQVATTDRPRKRKKKKKENKSILIPLETNPSKLMTTLSERYDSTRKITHACWVKDEASSFFQKLREQDYMIGMDTLLSQLYDGADISSETQARGTEEVLKPYLTIAFSGTGSMIATFTEELIQQGFLNRFIFVPEFKKTELISEEDQMDTIMSNISYDLYIWLKALYDKKNSIVMYLESSAREAYNRMTSDIEHMILKGKVEELQQGYFGNLPELVKTIAALFRIGRMSLNDIRNSDNESLMAVEAQDMERAVACSNEIWSWFTLVLERMAPMPRYLKEQVNIKNRVDSAIPEAGITRAELYRKLNLTASVLDTAIQSLISEGKIEMKIDRSSEKSSIWYRRITNDKTTK